MGRVPTKPCFAVPTKGRFSTTTAPTRRSLRRSPVASTPGGHYRRTSRSEPRVRDDRASQLELLKFQAQELAGLDLRDDEVEPLTAEGNRLANVDQLLGSLNSVLGALDEADEISAHQLIAGAQRTLDGLTELDPALVQPAQLLGEAENSNSGSSGRARTLPGSPRAGPAKA